MTRLSGTLVRGMTGPAGLIGSAGPSRILVLVASCVGWTKIGEELESDAVFESPLLAA